MDNEQRFLEAQKLYQKQIADLESKLAESEKKREELDFAFEMETNSHKEGIEFFSKQVKSIQKENKKLKQQLAEKEKEVQKWKNKKVKYLVDNLLVDKNLAIAELEKVRDCFEDYLRGLLWNDTILVGKVCNMINEIIDQQIKSLKGESR